MLFIKDIELLKVYQIFEKDNIHHYDKFFIYMLQQSNIETDKINIIVSDMNLEKCSLKRKIYDSLVKWLI